MKRKRSSSAERRPGNFDAGLRERAAAFLVRPVPVELQRDYVPDSLADRLLAACAKNEEIDSEALELGELVSGEYEGLIAAAQTAELKAYYSGSRDLLAEIIAAARR